MALFLGVDGGGTKTHAVLLDADGREVASGTSGSTNRNSVGAETAAANLRQAIEAAVAAAGPGARVDGAVFAMSGVDRPGDREAVREWVAGVLPDGAPLRVENDAVGALAAGTGGRLAGVVCIAGTGQISYGRNAAGDESRCGGFGCLTDGGSGYDLGVRALRATFSAHDGTGPDTPLAAMVREHCGVERTEDLIGWTYSDLAFARVAGLALHVFRAAEGGCPVAAALLDGAADALALGVRTVARKLGYAPGDDLPVVAAGSVCQNPAMRARLEERVRREFGAARVVMPPVTPAVGAAQLAARAAAAT